MTDLNLKPGDFVVVKESNKMLWGEKHAFPIGQILKFDGEIVIVRNFSVLNDSTNMKLTIRKRHVRTSISYIEKLTESHPFYKEYMQKINL